MKKLLLLAALAVSTVASAHGHSGKQCSAKAKGSCCKMEDPIKPRKKNITTEFALSPKGSDALLNLQGGALRGRYFLKDQLALRASLGLGYEYSDKNSTESSKTSLALGVGIEKHFKGTRRLSPYIGAELQFQVTQEEMKLPQTATQESNDYGPGLNLFFGADYYILPHIYVGAEAGLGLANRTVDRAGITYSHTTIGTDFIGGLRFGFVF